MPKSRHSLVSTAFPIAAVAVAMISIQSGASLAKRLFPVLGAPGATTLRLTLAALILCGFWRPWKQRLTRRESISIVVYGLSLGTMNFLFYLAIERIPLGVAVAVEFTGPLTIALMSSKKSPDFVWAALAIVGVFLILPMKQASATLDPLGIAYAVGAGISWALYIVFGQKAGASTHAGTVTALGMATAALLVIPAGVYQAGTKLFSPSILPIAFAVAMLSSAIPYSLEMIALKRLAPNNFGILMSLEPAIAALSGLVFLNEHLAATQWIAVFCIMLASFGSSSTAGNHPPQDPVSL